VAQSIKPTIRVFPDHEKLSRAAAEGFIYFSNKALEKSDRFNVALSGGETPRCLYEALAGDFSDRVQWDFVHLYWGDERYVSQRDKRSNFHMFHQTLLYHLHIPLGNIHPMPTHRASATDAAHDYERYMRTMFDGEWPRMDVILLGMGRDAHVASIFPGSKAVADTSQWVMAVESPVEPRTRLTFTLPTINAASDICFVVSGEDKAETLRSVLNEPSDPSARPASGVRPTDGQLIWWVDEAAFSKVDPTRLGDAQVERPAG